MLELRASSDDEDLFWIEGKPQPQTDNDKNWSLSYVVEEDYLKVMGIPLQRGRFFTAQDNENASHVVVVDEVFAKKYFPDWEFPNANASLAVRGSSSDAP